MSSMMRTRKRPNSQRGSALLEGLIAILILSMGILALMGLQGTAVKQAADAKYRSDASFLANQIIGEMWVDRANLAQYANIAYGPRAAWDTQIGNVLPGGNGNIVIAGTTVTVTVGWTAAGQTGHQYEALATITGNAP
jgi:type IV pilus assembly protein PilV